MDMRVPQNSWMAAIFRLADWLPSGKRLHGY